MQIINPFVVVLSPYTFFSEPLNYRLKFGLCIYKSLDDDVMSIKLLISGLFFAQDKRFSLLFKLNDWKWNNSQSGSIILTKLVFNII